MIKTIIGSIVVASSMFAMSQAELDSFRHNELLKGDNIKFIAGKKINKDFALIKGYVKSERGIAPVKIITDNNIVIANGVVYDAKSKQRITIDIDYKKHLKDEAFTIGNGKKDLFLFSEPECPYCVRFEDELSKFKKDEYKLHVFMFPLEQIHFLAKDMSIAVLSQPIKDRAAYNKKLMDLKKTDTKALLKELFKYTPDVYRKVLVGVNNLNNSREGQIAQTYIKMFENAEGKKFNGVLDIAEYCKGKIAEFEKDKTKVSYNAKVSSILDKQQLFGTAYIDVKGTPSLFDMDGNQFDPRKIFNN